MNILRKLVYFLLRVSLGWIMLYAGITKVLDSSWTAKGYISQTKIFANFYSAFLTPSSLPIIDFLNKWGLVLIGISLILGIFVRFSAPFGAMLMILYYFPALNFPYAAGGKNYYVIDYHIIFALTFLLFAIIDVGKYWGLDYYRAAIRK